MQKNIVSNQTDINHILENKLHTYAEFLAATLQLKDAFEAENMGKIEQLTNQREDMIRVVNELDYQMNLSSHDDGGGKKRLLITDDIKKLLHRIIEANKDCELLATVKRDLARSDLTTVKRQEKVISVYTNKTHGTPKFLDVRT